MKTNAVKQGKAAALPLNMVIGDRDLCAWRPEVGVWWVQTRNPDHARRLAQRRDGRLVARGVAGGFLRIFEFAKPAVWGARLLARYTIGETTTGGAKTAPKMPQDES